jgi:hypothetical protein
MSMRMIEPLHIGLRGYDGKFFIKSAYCAIPTCTNSYIFNSKNYFIASAGRRAFTYASLGKYALPSA